MSTNKSAHILAVLLVALVLFVTGCPILPPPTTGGGLLVRVSASPSSVFSSRDVTISVDLENKNPRTVTDVTAQVFDTGILVSPPNYICWMKIDAMGRGDFKTLSCNYRAPPRDEIIESQARTTVNARVEYTTNFALNQVVEMMTEDEYSQRQQAGTLVTKSASYTYQDENVAVDVEFSEPLPLVFRDNVQKDYLVNFKIRNIGNGLIKGLKHGDFSVGKASSQEPDIVVCPSESTAWKLEPNGKEFPKITCQLTMPGGFRVVENYNLFVNLRYVYEVRQSTTVIVMK